MPDYALLLAHDEHPDPTTDWPTQPAGPCEGWAEWFDSVPLLFSVLLGDARHCQNHYKFCSKARKHSWGGGTIRC